MYIHTYEILDVWRLWWYLFIRLSIDGHDQSQLTLFSDLHRVTDLHLQPGIVIVPIHVSSLLYCRREKKKRNETIITFHHDLLKNEFIVLIYNFNIIIYIYRYYICIHEIEWNGIQRKWVQIHDIYLCGIIKGMG